MSLAEQICDLANPAPVFNDPEDTHDGSAAVVCQNYGHDDISAVATSHSKLRQRALKPLADFDRRYAGRTVSRSKLQTEFPDEQADVESADENSSEDYGDKDDDDDVDDNDDNDLEDNNDTSRKIDAQQADFSFTNTGDYGQYGDDSMDSEGDSEGDTEGDGDGDSEGDSGQIGEDDDDDDEDIESGDELPSKEAGVQSFSKTSVADEIEKGKAAKTQLGLWDTILEGRIKMQKVLLLVNQLPQPTKWQTFLDQSDEEYKHMLKDGGKSLHKLLAILVELQTALLRQNGETAHMMDGAPSGGGGDKRAGVSDEEITSESEEEDGDRKMTAKDTTVVVVEQPASKRRRTLSIDAYDSMLVKRHDTFKQYRNTTIQKWYDKTQVSAGKLSKGFSAFEQSALKQIDQILSDRPRLIRRTQLKRSAYSVLGEADKSAVEEHPAQDNQEILQATKESLNDYDEEIFDDDDFYHQLLRELIERKTTNISDPIELSRHWLQIQKLRSKVKKKVDTRASKGRKVRYDIHRKLMNLMAPMETSVWSDESRTDLYKSLFGKIQPSTDLTTSTA